MEESNREIEMMRQIIEKKKAKSASQGSVKKRPEDRNGTISNKSRKQQKDSEAAGESEPAEEPQ